MLMAMNIFAYMNQEEVYFRNYFAQVGDYQVKYTFFGDLSIAEVYGKASVKDTYKNVMQSWIGGIEAITEFCMALNIKSWEWDARAQQEGLAEDMKNNAVELSELYADLFYKCRDKIYEHYKDNSDALDYFYRTTD